MKPKTRVIDFASWQPVIPETMDQIDRIARHYADARELERRAALGDMSKFNAAMDKVPDVPPMPGDEL